MKPDNERISQRDLRRGLVVNVAAGALGMTWFGFTQAMPLTMLMETLGASAFLNGLIVTVQQLAMFLQIPAAIVAERLANRKRFWASIAFVHRVIWFLPAVLPFIIARGTPAGPVAILLVMTASSLLANIVTAAWWSWMADLIPERTRGRFWGTRQGFTMLAYLLSIAAAGYILDVFPDPRDGGSFAGFALVFGLGALAGCLDIVVHLWVPEPRPARPAAQHAFVRIRSVLRNREFMWLTAAMGAWSFALGLIGTFGILYLTRVYHVRYSHLALTTISASIGTILAGFAWGRVIDRVGARSFSIAMMIVSPLFGVAWFVMRDAAVAIALPAGLTFTLPQPIVVLLAVNFVAGAAYSAVSLSHISLTAAMTESHNRTLAMGVHWSTVGLLAALGPAVGGKIVDIFASRSPEWIMPTGTSFGFMHALVILHMLIIWLVAAPLLSRITRRTNEMPLRTLVGNPLRAISIIQNIGTASAAGTGHERARAVRELGLSKTAFAVSELIRNLDDPAAEVREEAVEALGHIGSPEAVEALLGKLEDPESDLGPLIARALKQSRAPEAVEGLMRTLAAPDREMAAQSARALGEIGDRRASPLLLNLLQHTDDSTIVRESSQALARLGEMAAIYEILPRMKATRNPVLKRSLAVAVGDLLGQPGEFYRTLTSEEQEPGVERERRIERLRQAIRSLSRDRFASEGQALVAIADDLSAACEAGRIDDAALRLFDLAIGIAAIRFGVAFGNDSRSFINDLIWRDQRVGVGVWFLNLLRNPSTEAYLGKPDELDILLGIHFLESSIPNAPPGLFALR